MWAFAGGSRLAIFPDTGVQQAAGGGALPNFWAVKRSQHRAWPVRVLCKLSLSDWRGEGCPCMPKRKPSLALVGWVSRLEHPLAHQKTGGLIPGQGTPPGCRFNPKQDACRGNWLMFLSLPLCLPLSLKSINVSLCEIKKSKEGRREREGERERKEGRERGRRGGREVGGEGERKKTELYCQKINPK